MAVSNPQPFAFKLSSRWLNCDGKGAVISGSRPGAILLNDSVYMNGSRSNNNRNIWNYSITRNSISWLSYPPNALNVSACYQTLASYQSQLLWIGKDEYSNKIKVFALVDETTHCWKEIMQDIPQVATPRSPIISAASEGRYLIVVRSMGRQQVSALIFDGLNWKRIDSPSSTPTYAYGETEIIIQNGIAYLSTQMELYKIYLEASLAANHLMWKKVSRVPDFHSNLTGFNGHIIVVLTANNRFKSGNGGYIYILAYEPIADNWLMLEKFQCHLCWSTPSIIGLPGGRLLILGVVPDLLEAPLFNILEITAKGKPYPRTSNP